MRIGIVIRHCRNFKASRYVIEVSRYFCDRGHEVHVFCSDSDKEKRIKKRYEIKDNIHIHRSPYWIRLSLSTHIFPGLINELSKEKFDIIHSHVSGHWYILISGIILVGEILGLLLLAMGILRSVLIIMATVFVILLIILL